MGFFDFRMDTMPFPPSSPISFPTMKIRGRERERERKREREEEGGRERKREGEREKKSK